MADEHSLQEHIRGSTLIAPTQEGTAISALAINLPGTFHLFQQCESMTINLEQHQ